MPRFTQSTECSWPAVWHLRFHRANHDIKTEWIPRRFTFITQHLSQPAVDGGLGGVGGWLTVITDGSFSSIVLAGECRYRDPTGQWYIRKPQLTPSCFSRTSISWYVQPRIGGASILSRSDYKPCISWTCPRCCSWWVSCHMSRQFDTPWYNVGGTFSICNRRTDK